MNVGYDESIPEEIRDKDTIIRLLSDQSNDWFRVRKIFKNSSEELRSDRQIVMEAIVISPEALEYASPVLRDDKEVVMVAVTKRSNCLQFASNRLKNDRDIVMRSLESFGRSICYNYAGEEIKKDRDIALKALEKHNSLSSFREEFRNDRVFVSKAVKRNGKEIQFAGESLQKDPELVHLAVCRHGRALCFVLEEFRDDKETVLMAVSNDGEALEFASARLKNDIDVVLTSVSKKGKSLQFASPELRDNKEIVISASKSWGHCLQFASPRLQDDKEVVIAAVTKHGMSLKFASPRLRSDDEVVTESVKSNMTSMNFASEELHLNRGFVTRLVQIRGGVLGYLSEEMCNDEEVAYFACMDDQMAFSYVGEDLKSKNPLLKCLSECRGNLENGLDIYTQAHGMVWKFVDESKSRFDWREVVDVHMRGCDLWGLSHSVFVQGKQFGEEEAAREADELRELGELLKEKKFKDIKFHRKLGRGCYGSTYLCSLRGVNGIYVVKIYNNVEMNEEKKDELLARDCIPIPYSPNTVSILSYKDNEKIDARILPDYHDEDSPWKNSFQIFANVSYTHIGSLIFMKYHRMALSSSHHLTRGPNSFPHTSVRTGTESLCLILKGLLEGVVHLHKNMIVHRDLHPGNVFMNAQHGRIWIGDFGCALDLRKNQSGFLVYSEEEIMFSFVTGGASGFKVGGAVNYLPPEISNFDKEGNYLNYEKCDVFSVGVIARELLRGSETKNRMVDVRIWKEFVVLNSLQKRLTDHDCRKRIGCVEARDEMDRILKSVKLKYASKHQ